MKKFLHRLSAVVTPRDGVMMISLLIACVILWQLELRPAPEYRDGSKYKAVVLSTDNSDIREAGSVQVGSQLLQVKVLEGKFQGKVFQAANELRAQLDLDKIFVPGDKVLVSILDGANSAVDVINAQDHYRFDHTLILFGLFALLLIIFGSITGFNALLSFVFSCLMIWKVVIPLCLQGVNALLISFSAVLVLSAVIIFLVSGLNRRGVTAFAGTLCGVAASSVMAYIFTGLFHINGAVMPYSQVLLNSGFGNLNLPELYIGAIFLSSSGAVMDLAMDVASGMQEVIEKRPDLSRKELLISGIRIGRNVVGTMTTTLLLAYSGGYLTLMMVFAAQNTLVTDFINNPHVASELVKTLVGSFGLVLVAPFTAFLGSLLLKRREKSKNIEDNL